MVMGKPASAGFLLPGEKPSAYLAAVQAADSFQKNLSPTRAIQSDGK